MATIPFSLALYLLIAFFSFCGYVWLPYNVIFHTQTKPPAAGRKHGKQRIRPLSKYTVVCMLYIRMIKCVRVCCTLYIYICIIWYKRQATDVLSKWTNNVSTSDLIFILFFYFYTFSYAITFDFALQNIIISSATVLFTGCDIVFQKDEHAYYVHSNYIRIKPEESWNFITNVMIL